LSLLENKKKEFPNLANFNRSTRIIAKNSLFKL